MGDREELMKVDTEAPKSRPFISVAFLVSPGQGIWNKTTG
jgi:hypothetical protein